MKVLQINSVYKYGSTGKIVAQISKIVEANGDESYIAYGRNFVEKSQEIMCISNRFLGFLDLLQTRVFDNHGFGMRFGTKKLIKFIDSVEPDIIHLHNIHGYYLNVQLLFEYLAKKKMNIVWTLHDCWPFTGHCAYFDAVKCYKWIEGCSACPGKNIYPASWLVDNSRKNWEKKKRLFSMPHSITIVTPSEWLEKQVKNSFLRGYDTRVINNGIDSKVFFPRGNKWKENNMMRKPIVFACASKWEMRKGLADIPRVAALKPEYQFIIVGVDAKQMKGLPPEIIAIERTDNVDELAEIYSSADVFINPTYDDNFPTTNIEALACGTPVVTYTTGGSPEALDSTTGIVVEKGDIQGFARAITEVIEGKPKKFSKEQCIARAAKFSMEDRFHEYYILYRNIFESRRVNVAEKNLRNE